FHGLRGGRQGRGSRRRLLVDAVARLLHGRAQVGDLRLNGVEAHARLLRGEVDVRFADAGHLCQRLLHAAHAGGARHPGDGEGLLRRCRALGCHGWSLDRHRYFLASSKSSFSSLSTWSSRPSAKPVRTQPSRWPWSMTASSLSSARLTACVCLRMSTQYWSSSIILRMPLMWPSM